MIVLPWELLGREGKLMMQEAEQTTGETFLKR